MFVCFAPLYFVYGGTVPRDFGLFERLMSLLYAIFFIIFLPFFAAYRDKVWINWGLASYGVLIYLVKYLYPAEALITGEDASIPHMILAVSLRGIYGMMQAPFAALSTLIGDKAASALVYWILPVSLIWPLFLKVLRFYRRAYLSEQLNPMPKVQSKAQAAHSGPAVKPEVLGTIITAPEVAASPDVVTGQAALSQSSSARDQKNEEPEALDDGKKGSDSIPLADAIRPVEPAPSDKSDDVNDIEGPEVSGTLGEGRKKREPESDASASAAPSVIELGAPAPSSQDSGDAGLSGSEDKVPSDSGDGVIELGAPLSASGDSGEST